MPAARIVRLPVIALRSAGAFALPRCQRFESARVVRPCAGPDPDRDDVSGDHQHVEDDDRRKREDHRPDADGPQNVRDGEALLGLTILDIHVAPCFAHSCLGCDKYAKAFKKLCFNQRAFQTQSLPRVNQPAIAPSVTGERAQRENRAEPEQHGPEAE